MRNLLPHDDSDEFDVDEPEEFEESGSDWDPEEEDAGKKRKGKSKTASPKKSLSTRKKKFKKDLMEVNKTNYEKEFTGKFQSKTNGVTSSNPAVKAFANGSFVILKSDLQSNSNPPLWKIDGKALLQKYIPFNQDGKILYKNTSTYSGWTQSNQGNYIPAPVAYIQQGKKEIIVEFHKDKVSLEDQEEEKQNESENITTEPVSVSTIVNT